MLSTATIPKTIHSDPEIMGGTPVFVGTRVPVQTMFDHLKAGDPLAEFLDDFPTVARDQAIATLEEAQAYLLTQAISDADSAR